MPWCWASCFWFFLSLRDRLLSSSDSPEHAVGNFIATLVVTRSGAYIRRTEITSLAIPQIQQIRHGSTRLPLRSQVYIESTESEPPRELGSFLGMELGQLLCRLSLDRSVASRWIRRQPHPWKKNVGHLGGLRQQRAKAVGLMDHPTVHVVVTGQPQVSVTASEDGTPEERNGYAFHTHFGLPLGRSHGCFSILNRGKSISMITQPGLLDRTLIVANVTSIKRNSIRGRSIRYLEGGHAW